MGSGVEVIRGLFGDVGEARLYAIREVLSHHTTVSKS